MKTINEIRIEAIRIINKAITLKANVNNGCISDQDELDVVMVRLENIRKWAVENDQIQEIRHYFASKNFGQNAQFAASEIAKMF